MQTVAKAKTHKLAIYQIFMRLFGNQKLKPVLNGSKFENGSGTFNDLNESALASILDLGFNHVWLTGIIQHASQTRYSNLNNIKGHPSVVKGKAGSPYAITDFFELDPDLASNPELRWQEFENCVKRIHNQGLKLIVDFVPNHTARQYSSVYARENGLVDLGQNDFTHEFFHPNNNYYYIPNEDLEIPDNQLDEEGNAYKEFPAKATGNDAFSSKPSIFDWYETVKLNYGFNYQNQHGYYYPIPSTWTYMLEVLRFWSSKRIDAFRCDMVELVPVEFWEWAIPKIKSEFPDIVFIAEVYNPEKYHSYLFRGHFDYLYDKVGLYDELRSLVEGKGNANHVSAVWQKQEGFGERMLRFMENHDEQRIASDFVGKEAEKALPAMAISAFMGKGPVMVYFGQEFGEKAEGSAGFSGDDGKTTIFDYWNVPGIQKWQSKNLWNDKLLNDKQINLRLEYKKILNFCQNKAIVHGSFFDLQYANQENSHYESINTFSFLRFEKNEKYLFINTFETSQLSLRIVIPYEAWHALGISQESRCQLLDPFGGKAPIDFYVKTSYWSEGNSAGILIPSNRFEYQIWKLDAIG